jgi:glycosyltransferase involved in cell wall biosynthesis
MSISPIGSVVIPAHNEATTIRRCLDALLAGFAPSELDVAVSCNGCTDGTADIVRSSWPAVQVIEVTKASKPAALRAADEALSVFPRIYLDADVVLPATSARQIIDYLRTGLALAARPPISYDTTDAVAVVRSYYRARSRLFSIKKSLWAGGGAYAVSAGGRARYDAYPDIIADDLFADKWFRRSEIEIIGSEPSIITVPRGVRDLFRVLRRRYLGNVQIQDLPEPPEPTAQSTLRNLIAMVMSSPGAAVDTAVFLAIVTAVRITLRLSPPAGWNRDESSRIPATTST